LSNFKPDLSGFRGSLNLRDLGGYSTRDGRKVKHGLLFRSAALGEANEKELEMIKGLGLRYILDLRSKNEESELPDPAIEGAENERISGAIDADGNEVDLSPENCHTLMYNPRRVDPDPEDNVISAVEEVYASLAFDNSAYRRLLSQMEQGVVPLLFHCTAGKDRTGIAAIVILLALGVEEKAVVDDYELTNEYRKAVIEAKMVKHPFISRFKLGRYVLRAVGGVHRSFGQRVLVEICQEYGSIDVYLEKEYGLVGQRLEALRDQYLE